MNSIRVLRVCPNIKEGLGHNLRPFIDSMCRTGIKQKVLSLGIDFDSRAPFSAFRAGFEAAKKINLTDYDLIHVHNPSFWGLLMKARGKVKTIVTFHGSFYYTLKHFYVGDIKQNLYYLFNGLLSLMFADKVIFINKKDEWFFSHFTKKCFFIPPGYDQTIFKGNSSVERKRQVLFVGRDNPNKNFKAVVSFCEKNKLPLAAVHGDSKYSPMELAKLYRESKYLALFSYSEGFGKVLLEGVACGCVPVLTKTTHENMRELGISFLAPDGFDERAPVGICSNLENVKTCTWESVSRKTFHLYRMMFGSFFYPGQKVLVVEPHNDDAMLSLGGIILSNPKVDFTILSIISNNGFGTKKLSRKFGNVRSVQLNLKGVHNGESEEEFFSRNKLSKEQFVQKLRKFSLQQDVVLMPFGEFHPMHKLIGRIRFYNSIRYLDLPYGISKVNIVKLPFRMRFLRSVRFNVKKFLKRKTDLITQNYGSSVKEFMENGPGRKVKEFDSEVLFY